MTDTVSGLFAGFGISFLGSLPLGNLNIASTQLSVQENFKSAWLFSIGIAIVEVIYLRLALSGSNWMMHNQTLFTFLSWFTVVLFYFLGVLSIIKAVKQKDEKKKGMLINNHINRFLLGIMLSAVNPLQIPFWFFWSTYFIQNNIIQTTSAAFNLFTIGACLGTLSGQAVYIYGGNWLIKKLRAGYKLLNIFMGLIFIISASVQLYKIFFGNGLK